MPSSSTQNPSTSSATVQNSFNASPYSQQHQQQHVLPSVTTNAVTTHGVVRTVLPAGLTTLAPQLQTQGPTSPVHQRCPAVMQQLTSGAPKSQTKQNAASKNQQSHSGQPATSEEYSKMDFGRLPKDVFLEILDNLDLAELVRAQRISRLWYDMCILTLRERPISFDFFHDFKTIPANTFRRFFQLCHRRIESIYINFYKISDDDTIFPIERIVELLAVMAEFNYSKLDELVILSSPAVCADLFLTLIRNASNLKVLSIDGRLGDNFFTRLLDNSGSMLDDVSFYSSPEAVFTPGTFRLVGQRWKNLKRFAGAWVFEMTDDEDADTANMNYFFGECAQLRDLSYNETDIFNEIPNFWKLQFLETITIDDNFTADDTFLHSLCASFPLLNDLEITVAEDATVAGVAFLHRLQKLQRLVICAPADLVLSNEFVAVVENFGSSITDLTISNYETDAATLKEAAIKYADKKAVLRFFVADEVKNVIEALDHLFNVGIKFECEGDYHPRFPGSTVPYRGSIPALISELKNLEPGSDMKIVWRSE